MSKRSLEQQPTGQSAIEKKTKLSEDPDVHEVRVLIPSSSVGSIIGRGGSNITRVRTECSVFASVKDAPKGVQERILTIKGLSASISLALHHFGGIVVEAQQSRLAKMAPDQQADVKDASQCEWKLLLHASLVGGIIGKGGVLVKQTQTSTGARVQVSSDALAGSSEKTVTVSGSVEQVYAALQIVVGQIKENSLRPGVRNIEYVPSVYGAPQSYAPYGAPQGYGAPTAPYQRQSMYPPSSQGSQSYGAPPSQQYSPYSYQQQQQGGGGSGGAGYQGGGGGYQQQQPPYMSQQHSGYSAPSQGGSSGQALNKQQIVIPTVCAGNVIGRGGTIIAGIKQQSGTFISIAPAESTSPHERMATISGSRQGIQTAVYLIRQIVEQYESPSSTF